MSCEFNCSRYGDLGFCPLVGVPHKDIFDSEELRKEDPEAYQLMLNRYAQISCPREAAPPKRPGPDPGHAAGRFKQGPLKVRNKF